MTHNIHANFLTSALLGATLALGLIGGADAATSIYLKVPGIVGPSLDLQHVGEIPILGFSTSASATAGGISIGGGGGGSKATCGKFIVLKQVDQTSPVFLGDLFTGKHIASATLSFVSVVGDSGASTFYKIDLSGISITDISQSDPQDSQRITETITFNAIRYKFTYTPVTSQGAAGVPVIFGWDCSQNKPF